MEDSVKLAFLNELIKKNQQIKNQLIVYAQQIDLNIVDNDIYSKICKKIKQIDLEDIYFNYSNNNCDYLFEEDGNEDLQNYILGKILDKYLKNILSLIENSNYQNGFYELLMVIKVSIYPPEMYDNYDIFSDDIGTGIEHYIKDSVNTIIDILNTSVITTTTRHQIISLFIETMDEFSSDDEDEYEDNEQEVYLSQIDNILKALLIDEESYKYFYHKLKDKDKINEATASILIYISKKLDDEKLFLDIATNYYSTNKDIALELLQYFKDKDDKTSFNKYAQKSFDNYKNHFDKFLMETYTFHNNSSLYKSALISYSKRNSNLKSYQKLSNLLTQIEKDEFVESIKVNIKFYVSILAYEKENLKILDVLNSNITEYSFNIILPITAKIFPIESFVIAKKYSQYIIQHDKSRSNYQRIASWLSILLTQKSNLEEFDNFIMELYNRKPALPALKDELRKHKLV